jgi:hypothetical protein
MIASITASSVTLLPADSGLRVVSLAVVAGSELDEETLVLFAITLKGGIAGSVMKALLVLIEVGALTSAARISASMPSRSSSGGASDATEFCCCLPFVRFFVILRGAAALITDNVV